MFGRMVKSNSVGIELRAFAKSDCATLLKYINKPDVNKWLSIDWSNTLEDEEAWFDAINKDPKKIVWGIYINGEIIGTASLINFNPITRNSEIGLMIGNNKYYKRGIGTEVVNCLCDYAFNELNCDCIHYEVSEENIASIKIAEKNGFVRSGFIPHYFYHDGKYYSVIYMYRLKNPDEVLSVSETESQTEMESDAEPQAETE